MLVIGLTGGIGSGKSTVAALFAGLGVPVIDTDRLARELVEPGQPALADIAQQFGSKFIGADGRLNRARLREHVFADTATRHRLEAILHPRIRRAVEDWLRTQTAPYVIVVVPLLLEGKLVELVDRILVVDVPEAIQRSRTMARDGLSETQFNAILHSQIERGKRLAAADDIIDNQGTEQALTAQVNALHQRYLALASTVPESGTPDTGEPGTDIPDSGMPDTSM